MAQRAKTKARAEPAPVRCATRAVKNARFLQERAPELFGRDDRAPGFGTGVPLEILQRLHTLDASDPALSRHPSVAEFLLENRMPVPARDAREALFSGTVHFVQVTFKTSGGNLVIPTPDMNQIVQYAQHAAVPMAEYAAQYGPTQLTIATTLLGFTFAYYTAAVVRSGTTLVGANNCMQNPTTAACQYAPVQQDCQLVVDKQTYGADEVAAQLPGTASYPSAFWVAVDGFTGEELGFTTAADLANPSPNPAPAVTVSLDDSLNTRLSGSQIATIRANLPAVNLGPLPVVATDPTLTALTQRFLYPYTVAFGSSAAFDTLTVNQAAVLTLSVSFTIGSVTVTDSALLELVKGENPFYVNVNPSDAAQPTWLSFDLRFFKVAVPSGGSVTRFGASMTSSAADAPGFIASAIANLTRGGGAVGADTFEGLTQDEDASALEFLQQDAAGRNVFNFALARVRLLGKTAGATAANVRVFFRLFNAQTTASSFDESTAYRLSSDGMLNGHKIPLLGMQNDSAGHPEYVTIPCFASPRINLTSPVTMAQQTDPPNVQTITVNPGLEVDTFFGCWLDINQPGQAFLPSAPPAGNPDGGWSGITLSSINQAITRAPHQCLIAEIRSDDAPIPPGANSGNSDKLAQRNIAWIDGPNPGIADSRRLAHPFELKPSSREFAVPDELMILWGATPAESTATVLLPGLSAAAIVKLADSMYRRHSLSVQGADTIACPASGATFLPIPAGVGRQAGLLTITLPEGISKGDHYTVAVRQVSSTSFRPPPPPQELGRARSLAARDFITWRQVTGAFQFGLTISTKDALLPPEERLLAWLRWIFLSLPTTSRWYPVWKAYLEVIAGRVAGFGGDPGSILPSPTGAVPKVEGIGVPLEFTGKVVGIAYDRFGDFEGFLLLDERGSQRPFRATEHAIERLVRRAWEEREVITVVAERKEPSVPVSIILRRAPESLWR